MAKETEEKSLPASEKKLRDARKKGQVASSRDLVAGISFLAVLSFLYIFRARFFGGFVDLVESVARAGSEPFGTALAESGRLAAWLIFATVVPILAILLFFVVVPAIVMMRGLIFSFDPVKPQFQNISPVAGLQRLFSLRSVIEFVKGLVKVVLLSALFITVTIGWLEPLFQAPSCGPGCLAPVATSVLVALGAAGALSFVLLGMADIPIQRWLFSRDMRMTRSEYRRERRDIDGDPFIQREFYRLRSEAMAIPRHGARANPTVVFVDDDRALAIRFVKGETPIPAVVGKADGVAGNRLAAMAGAGGIPVVTDCDLVATIYPRARAGEYLHEDFFSLVSPHLVRLNQV